MIQLSRNYSLPERDNDLITIKVVGIGGAGSNALDRIVLDGLERAELIAMNTDVQALASSVAAAKVQLGRTTTRGLGAGGDPEVGYNAAFESADEIRQAITDARMVFICAGLGGGTGSGAAPCVAQVARENGSLVIGFATMPFAFEGKRRMAQANEALAALRGYADAVICFENDRLGDIVAPRAGIHQAFAAADLTISQSVRSIVSIIQRPGLIRIGFDDLLSALRAPSGRCVFGFGESDSDNRAHDALNQALKNPLMDRGRMLETAANVLVQVAGGPGMTLTEVEILMKELGKHVGDQTHIIFGTSVDGRMGNRLSVTIISALAVQGDEPAAISIPAEPIAATPPPPAPVFEPSPPPPPVELRSIEARLDEPTGPAPFEENAIAQPEPPFGEVAPAEREPQFVSYEADPQPEAVLEAEPPPPPPPPPVVPPRRKPVAATPQPAVELPLDATAKHSKRTRDQMHAKQEVLQFEPVTRGRFEKSEPTIVEGQDLDVPTFLRKNVRVK
ncbi:MAG: cell division protein FtsZ [Chthoniobacterales bacterium]